MIIHLYDIIFFAASLEGVPPYPLYKRLALALHEAIASGSYAGTRNNVASIDQGSSLNEKECEWQNLISEKGSELVNVNTISGFVFETFNQK